MDRGFIVCPQNDRVIIEPVHTLTCSVLSSSRAVKYAKRTLVYNITEFLSQVLQHGTKTLISSLPFIFDHDYYYPSFYQVFIPSAILKTDCCGGYCLIVLISLYYS